MVKLQFSATTVPTEYVQRLMQNTIAVNIIRMYTHKHYFFFREYYTFTIRRLLTWKNRETLKVYKYSDIYQRVSQGNSIPLRHISILNEGSKN